MDFVWSRDDIAEILFNQRQTAHDWNDALEADSESEAGQLLSIVRDDAAAVLRLLSPREEAAPFADTIAAFEAGLARANAKIEMLAGPPGFRQRAEDTALKLAQERISHEQTKTALAESERKVREAGEAFELTLRGAVESAFQEGRESCSGTDRHSGSRAWNSSRAKAMLAQRAAKPAEEGETNA